jgi:hypothetical protein
MECNIQWGEFIDLGSLFACFQTLKDKRKRRGRRYSLALILLIILMAKVCGENHPSGIAEWAKHRASLLVEWLKLDRKEMPHHSTYRRILAEVIDAVHPSVCAAALARPRSSVADTGWLPNYSPACGPPSPHSASLPALLA